MTPETLAALAAIAFASCWTPGPNNAMLASSGATFGLARTIPHLLGVALGFPVMAVIVGLFLGEAFQRSALLQEGLRGGGAALLVGGAGKSATAGGMGRAGAAARPLRLHEAAAFQWINAKAWVMAVGTAAQFIRAEAPYASALWIGGVFVAAGITSALGGAAGGAALGRFLGTPARIRAFNRVMAAMIALGVVGMILG
ncbi:MAG: LysE family translocator [Gemmobacter sp.]